MFDLTLELRYRCCCSHHQGRRRRRHRDMRHEEQTRHKPGAHDNVLNSFRNSKKGNLTYRSRSRAGLFYRNVFGRWDLWLRALTATYHAQVATQAHETAFNP